MFFIPCSCFVTCTKLKSCTKFKKKKKWKKERCQKRKRKRKLYVVSVLSKPKYCFLFVLFLWFIVSVIFSYCQYWFEYYKLYFLIKFICWLFISPLLQALDLKPNYVRAWANMGISYANQVCSMLGCSFSSSLAFVNEKWFSLLNLFLVSKMLINKAIWFISKE